MTFGRWRRVGFAASLILALSILVAACDEPDFGDKWLNFVNNELPSLSREFARADLAVRWPSTFQILLLDVKTRIDNIRAVLQVERTQADRGEGSTHIDKVRRAKALEDVAIKALAEFERAASILETSRTICESRETFDKLGLNFLGMISALQSIQQVTPDISVEFTVGDGAGDKNKADFFTSLVKLFQASKVEEQNRKLQDAVRLAPEKVIKGDELFALSVAACTSARKDAAGGLDALLRLKSDTSGLITNTLSAIHSHRARHEVDGIAEALEWRSGGPTQSAIAFNQFTGVADDLRGRIRTEMQLAMNSLEAARRTLDGKVRPTLRVYITEQARADQHVLVGFLEGLRTSGILGALNDDSLSQLVVQHEERARKMVF
jgi:hypothetical protein